MKLPVYLDHNATSPVLPEVLASFTPYFTEYFGNAASKTHAQGWLAEQAVGNSRSVISSIIDASPEELIFCSGATEATNLGLKGLLCNADPAKNRVLVSPTEHSAVLDTLRWLESEKYIELEFLAVDSTGMILQDDLEKRITDNVIAVCIMLANNETGVIQPVETFSKITHRHKAYFFCDATQALGKIPVSVNELGVDLMCFSAHKFYGPKGIGALYVRKSKPAVKLKALIHGGGHENGLRSGTLNVPGIVGMASALSLANTKPEAYQKHCSQLRDMFENALLEIPGIQINGAITRISNTSNIRIQNVKASELISRLSNYAFSTGSACTSAKNNPSHVLSAMGLNAEECASSIRISFGWTNSEEQVKQAIGDFSAAIEQLRMF